MFTSKLLDEDSNLIKEFDHPNFADIFNQQKSILTLSKLKYQDFLDSFEEKIALFKPWNDGEDYVIYSVHQSVLKVNNAKEDDLRGCLYGESFPIYKKLGIIDLFNKAWNEGPVKFFYLLYEDGNLIYYFDMKIVRSADFIFMLTDDKTNEKRLEIEESRSLLLKNSLDLIQNSCKIVIFRWNPEGGYFWTSEIFNILEIDSIDKFNLNSNILEGFFVSDNPNYKQEIINELLANGTYSTVGKIETAKGNTKFINLFINANIQNGKILTLNGFLQDITDSVLTENKLKNLCTDLQSYGNKLEDNSQEKDILLKEVHHRVKNNLQIILSLLDLDLRFNNKDPKESIESTKNRIYSMALIHEHVYQSDDLAHVNIKEYIENEISYLFDSYSVENIELVNNIQEYYLTMEVAIPLGLILNEFILNVIKYAFPDNSPGLLKISFNVNEDNNAIFTIEDNGVGLPADLDIHNCKSLGLIIINSLSGQLDGEFSKLENVEGAGFKVEFPIFN